MSYENPMPAAWYQKSDRLNKKSKEKRQKEKMSKCFPFLWLGFALSSFSFLSCFVLLFFSLLIVVIIAMVTISLSPRQVAHSKLARLKENWVVLLIS